MADAVVTVAEVKGFKTQSGNTRFVLRDDAGREYTTFREQRVADNTSEACPTTSRTRRSRH
jgi:hypothetical protein